jgi:hypothetical protein
MTDAVVMDRGAAIAVCFDVIAQLRTHRDSGVQPIGVHRVNLRHGHDITSHHLG